MAEYRFRILNVFSESTFGGNPLCVFEDARGLSDDAMQALARQFNLSETTFLLPSTVAQARVRIFAPGYEMKFAGHPTLGSAHVVRELMGCGDSLSLEMKGGVVAVTAVANLWTLCAPGAASFTCRQETLTRNMLANMFGLDEADIVGAASWVDTGTDQLLIPLRSAAAINRARCDSTLLAQWPLSSLGRKTAYLFAADDWEKPQQVHARYFFTTQGGGVSEDPGTGSACANLGAWLLNAGYRAPFELRVEQGALVERSCHLHLRVSADREIFVGGQVRQLGSGIVTV